MFKDDADVVVVGMFKADPRYLLVPRALESFFLRLLDVASGAACSKIGVGAWTGAGLGIFGLDTVHI